ncbi:hypothetical protein SESBI_18921 [Sesbania bispinosa]|nr:hypothetical protein SESBI_18921 [Sesbania bispinosa]
MAQTNMVQILVTILLLVLVAGEAATTPPGIAKKRGYATCKVKKYKHCYNVVHQCPKHCPGGCEVDCYTCKPVCKCDRPGAVCQILVSLVKTATWEDSIDRLALSFDGEPIILHQSEGAKWKSSTVPVVSIVRTADTNSVIVEVEGKLRITAKVVPITEEDSRIHRYGITKEDCFAHLDLGFNSLVGNNGSNNEIEMVEDLKLPSMRCISGIDGEGVVCRR